MSEVSEKLTFRRELPRHLRELTILLGRDVSKDELLSLSETKELRAASNATVRGPSLRFELAFDEKRSPRFAEFVRRLAEATANDVYVWTPATNFCGVLRPVPLGEVQFGFPFDVNPEGILVFLTTDFRDKLLLDFSDESSGQVLEVELSGEHWSRIDY